MQNVYKILSLLLDYPSAELCESVSGIMTLVEEDGTLDKQQQESLKIFIDYVAPFSLAEWQMQYVQYFDYSPKTNLYLFDHVYGDSRERGQAMVDLNEMYNKSGYEPATNELPDFLPVFLEYLSLLEDENESGVLLKEVSHILLNMRRAMKKKKTPYFHLLDILCSVNELTDSKINATKEVEV